MYDLYMSQVFHAHSKRLVCMTSICSKYFTSKGLVCLMWYTLSTLITVVILLRKKHIFMLE